MNMDKYRRARAGCDMMKIQGSQFKIQNSGMKAIFFITAFLLMTVSAFAEEVSKPDTGDTAWILISTALVMLMTPGLALFYGGMVRRKNVLGTLMHSFVAIAIISLQWILIGYTLRAICRIQ